jgi:sigma-B regulation protein RsbU (phosphoserine phosphatase)
MLDDAPSELRIGTLQSDLARLYPWLDELTAARGWPSRFMNGMQVALEEAVMNVAMHAFPPAQVGQIVITFEANDQTVTLVVEDDGLPFDPVAAEAVDPRARLREVEPGGMGLTLMRHFCQDIGYERRDGRNRLTLRFLVPSL